MRRTVTAHLRAASSPNAARFAADFARLAGGDVLWAAYVPEGLRGWFERFADECDRSPRPDNLFRVVRLFDSPGADEISFLLDRIRAVAMAGRAYDHPSALSVSGEVAAVGDAIDRGHVHATALILDIHHLPLFARSLRARACRRSPAPAARTSDPAGASVAADARALLREIGAADLHLLVTTPDAGSAVGGHGPAGGAAASVRDALAEVVDLSLVVGAAKPAPDRPRHFPVRMTRSGDPMVSAIGDVAWASWEELLAPVRPPLPWSERLQRACPRLDAPPPLELLGNSATWTDATQEEFARRAAARGWTVEAASPEQDRREHWDLRIRRGAEDYRVDVKARSRIRRGDAEPRDDWHWIELRGIVDDGWLLGGQADLIAFRTAISFVLLRRDDLIAHVVHHVDPADVVNDPRAAVYRVYHRTDGAGREAMRPTGADRGVLTLVPTNRLRQLAWDAWGEESAEAGSVRTGHVVSAPE